MARVLSIVGIVLLAAVASGAYFFLDRGPREGPEQPIAFYHNVHAGQNQIPCMYCHYTADQSESAGIPSVKLCVGCHVPGSASLSPEEAQLAFPGPDRDTLWNLEAEKMVGYWRRGEPIPWVRVHNLPTHAKFPHASHVRVGVQCQTCHGPVEEMGLVYQFSSLQMGWCIDCHRGNLPLSEAEETSIRQRSTFVRDVAAAAAAGIDVRGVEAYAPNQRASTDCFVCHY
ncbi:MAG: cytochrome c3 family protein [Gemmatimonadetes bacterium]|nr:cytochrome c3 family protein [Gemmatimonadota bacterium]